MIYVGLDDTDVVGTPGTNQLARAIVRRLGPLAARSVICRHQLFFDSRVPYTSKNGSASIQLPAADGRDRDVIVSTVREVMHAWFVEGSDPGLCVAERGTPDMERFAARAKTEVVSQEDARQVAARAGCHLEGLGGTEQGIIGALAAIPLVSGGQDGRVVHLVAWPYPDDFTGPHDVHELTGRGVEEIRLAASGRLVTEGAVDVGKHLRPNWRDSRVVLYVEKTGDAAVPWRALKVL